MTTGDQRQERPEAMTAEESDAYLVALAGGAQPDGVTDAERILLDQLKGDVKKERVILSRLAKARTQVEQLEVAVSHGAGATDALRTALIRIEEGRRAARGAVEITETETDDPSPNGATEKASPAEA